MTSIFFHCTFFFYFGNFVSSITTGHFEFLPQEGVQSANPSKLKILIWIGRLCRALLCLWQKLKFTDWRTVKCWIWQYLPCRMPQRSWTCDNCDKLELGRRTTWTERGKGWLRERGRFGPFWTKVHIWKYLNRIYWINQKMIKQYSSRVMKVTKVPIIKHTGCNFCGCLKPS